MNIYCFDIEANGLVNLELDNKGRAAQRADTIHCIVVTDVTTGEVYPFRPHEITDAVERLKLADVIIGHNIVGYDLPAMRKLVGWSPTKDQKIVDTLIVGRLMHPDRSQLPKGLSGHALKDWAKYAGNYKMDYDAGWEVFSEEMLEYCIQDVDANISIYKLQLPWIKQNWKLINFEQQVGAICQDMTREGIGFDVESAQRLEYEMSARRAEIEDTLRQAFPDIVEERWSEKTGKRLKDKVTSFNPGSSQQWAQRLEDKYGWVAKTSDKGFPIVDEEVMSALPYDEAKLGLEYRDINKKITMVTDWLLRVQDDGCIHGRTNAQGTATGRASHSQPNVAQVPSDPRCRELFRPNTDGWVQVGCDLSGIELRCLAHYMAAYDDGAYAEEILSGDIHTHNQHAAGLETRPLAKTFIYAFLYGAGDAKLGSIVGGKSKDGARLKSQFFEKIPAMRKLVDAVQFKAEQNKRLKLIDGRDVLVRSAHKALNTLLQGAGAVVSKAWLVIAKQKLDAAGFDYSIMAWVHDELQVACPPQHADAVGKILVESAQLAGERLGFRCPVDAEFQVGQTWKDCH
jgi:DNA polymerase-1